jgi:hypothetical protein
MSKSEASIYENKAREEGYDETPEEGKIYTENTTILCSNLLQESFSDQELLKSNEINDHNHEKTFKNTNIFDSIFGGTLRSKSKRKSKSK